LRIERPSQVLREGSSKQQRPGRDERTPSHPEVCRSLICLFFPVVGDDHSGSVGGPIRPDGEDAADRGVRTRKRGGNGVSSKQR